MTEWPTTPVYLNHLEAMGIGMALMKEEMDDGLSEPQRIALEKIGDALSILLPELKKEKYE